MKHYKITENIREELTASGIVIVTVISDGQEVDVVSEKDVADKYGLEEVTAEERVDYV